MLVMWMKDVVDETMALLVMPSLLPLSFSFVCNVGCGGSWLLTRGEGLSVFFFHVSQMEKMCVCV